MNVVDGATIESRIRINRPNDENTRCKAHLLTTVLMEGRPTLPRRCEPVYSALYSREEHLEKRNRVRQSPSWVPARAPAGRSARQTARRGRAAIPGCLRTYHVTWEVQESRYYPPPRVHEPEPRSTSLRVPRHRPVNANREHRC